MQPHPEQTGDRMASRQVFFENIEFAPTDEIKIFCLDCIRKFIFNRYDIGPPGTSVPTELI